MHRADPRRGDAAQRVCCEVKAVWTDVAHEPVEKTKAGMVVEQPKFVKLR